MPKAQLVYILGDIHGDFAALNKLVKKIRKDRAVRHLLARTFELEVLFLQTGDFGYWPHEPSIFQASMLNNKLDFAVDGRAKIYFCDGNHENHDALDALEAAQPGAPFIEIAPGVNFARFGSTLTLLNGINVLFAGGAESCDAKYRVEGESWWRQEGIDEADMRRLPHPARTRVDWLISHTAPSLFTHPGKLAAEEKRDEPSRLYLEKIRRMYRPKRWWHGHYHAYGAGLAAGCAWVCLDYPGHGGPWLDKILIIDNNHIE